MSSELSNIDTLVLSGGSIKGYAYIGVFKKLDECGIIQNIKRISACSSGAIFGLLVVLKYSYSEMMELLNKIKNLSIYNFNIKSFLTDHGFDDFANIKSVIMLIMEGKGLSIDTTFTKLYEYNNVELIINSTCLTSKKTEYFSVFNYPNMPIIDAIQMSTAIPFIYTYVKFNDKYYVDGGVLDNLPISYSDSIDKSKILAVLLIDSNSNQSNNEQIVSTNLNLSQYLNLLINCIISNQNSLKTDKLHEYNVIKIFCNINIFSYPIETHTIDSLIKCGYHQTNCYLSYFIRKKNNIELLKKKIHIKIKK